MEQLIRAKQLTSVEQVLPYLPISFRSHYALAFHSRSLQSATYLNPRVILFGNNAKFILTFNGSAEQTGFNALELAEFNELSKTFSYQEILFPVASASTEGDNPKQVQFSSKNPDKCIACHGQQVRPIWDSPPVWPGMYGERYREPLSAAEIDGMTEFLAQQATHPRYRFLERVDIWRERDTFAPTHAATYSGRDTESPNAQLTQLLSRMNLERIAHQVTESPNFEAFSYALLASLSNNCASISDYFPSNWQMVAAPAYQQFSRSDELHLAREIARKNARELVSKSSGNGMSKNNSLLDFRFIAEFGLRIDTSEWSMQLEKNAADFSAIDAVQSKLEQRLLAKIAATDKDLINAFYYHSYPDKNKYCAYLEKRSIDKLAQQTPKELPVWEQKPSGLPEIAFAEKNTTAPKRVTELLLLCAGCHTTGVAPPIPFNNPALLRQKLKLPYAAKGTLADEILFRLSERAGAHRMPPNMTLSTDEQVMLEQFFRQ